MNFEQFYQIISYQFNNSSLVQEALTHPSLANERNYQRLEFLGDKVLSLVISEFLFKKYPDEMEGDLSKRHAAIVSKNSLSQIALDLKLDQFVILSKGEEKMQGRKNKSNLEDVLESLIGAIYLDSNYEMAQKFILNFFEQILQKNIAPPQDPISKLQEIFQEKFKILPNYNTVKIGGSDHEPEFESSLTIPMSNEILSAKGKSKKEAQKNLAQIALNALEK